MPFVDVRQRQYHTPSDSQPLFMILASIGFCMEVRKLEIEGSVATFPLDVMMR